MQVAPITNYNPKSQNNSFKGSVGYDISNYLTTKSQNYENAIKSLNVEKYPTLKLLWESQKKFSENILKNLKTVMSRFGKSCTLHWYPIFDKEYAELSAKLPVSPNADFYIESDDSRYKHYCGQTQIDFYDLDKFTTEVLANINPTGVVRTKFKLYANSPFGDSFNPEKNIPNLKDVLIDNSAKGSVSDETITKLKKEFDEYDKEFGVKS